MLGILVQPDDDAPEKGPPADRPKDGTKRGDSPTRISTRVAWPGLSLGALTLEVLLYGIILIVALAVRLVGLDQWPLTEVEANTALAAWRTLQGSNWRPAYYLPLLYDVYLVLFWFTLATDTATRIVPALVGAGLVLLPYYARDLLGRKTALVAALLLALGPSWVFFSRAADGAILATVAGAVLLLSAYRAAVSEQPRHFRVGAVALALGLTAGPQIYTMLLVTLFLLAAWVWQGRRSGRAAQARAWLGTLAARENLFILLGTFLFFAGGLTFNPSGIGASINLAGHWAQGLSPTQSGLPWYAYPRNLLLYEFLAIILALVGGVWGIQRRSTLDYGLAAWAGLALLLGVIGHREAFWLLDSLLPLTLLAARGVEKLWDSLLPGSGLVDLVTMVLLVPVLGFVFLQVAAFTQSAEVRYLDYARIVLGALLVLWAAYAIWGRRESAQRVGAALLLLILVAMTLRTTTAVAYQTGRDPREPLVSEPVPSTHMLDLLQEAATLSSRQAGDPHILDVDYEDSLDPWLGWYLRDYPNSRAVPALEPEPVARALLTTFRGQEAWPVGYMGQRFRWLETRPEQMLDLRQRLRWFIYREPLGTIDASEVYLWVRLPTAQSAP